MQPAALPAPDNPGTWDDLTQPNTTARPRLPFPAAPIIGLPDSHLKDASGAAMRPNAASLSPSGVCQQVVDHFWVTGSRVAVVAGGPHGSGSAYLPGPVLARKPRRAHSASWVSMLRG